MISGKADKKVTVSLRLAFISLAMGVPFSTVLQMGIRDLEDIWFERKHRRSLPRRCCVSSSCTHHGAKP